MSRPAPHTRPLYYRGIGRRRGPEIHIRAHDADPRPPDPPKSPETLANRRARKRVEALDEDRRLARELADY